MKKEVRLSFLPYFLLVWAAFLLLAATFASSAEKGGAALPPSAGPSSLNRDNSSSDVALSWVADIYTQAASPSSSPERVQGSVLDDDSALCALCLFSQGWNITKAKESMAAAPICMSLKSSDGQALLPPEFHQPEFMEFIIGSEFFASQVKQVFPEFAQCLCAGSAQVKPVMKQALELLPKCQAHCLPGDQQDYKNAVKYVAMLQSNLACDKSSAMGLGRAELTSSTFIITLSMTLLCAVALLRAAF